jgi:hypothetical protein
MVRIFRVYIPLGVVILFVSEVLLIVGIYIAAAFLGYGGDPYEYLTAGSGSLNIVLVAISILVGLYMHDLYTDVFIKSHLALVQQALFYSGLSRPGRRQLLRSQSSHAVARNGARQHGLGRHLRPARPV